MNASLERRASAFLVQASLDFASELCDTLPPCSDDQRAAVGRLALLHLRRAYLHGVNDLTGHVRRHGTLPPAVEESISAALLRAIEREGP